MDKTENRQKRMCKENTDKEEITTDTTKFKKHCYEQVYIKIFENRDEVNSQENIKYCNRYKKK